MDIRFALSSPCLISIAARSNIYMCADYGSNNCTTNFPHTHVRVHCIQAIFIELNPTLQQLYYMEDISFGNSSTI